MRSRPPVLHRQPSERERIAQELSERLDGPITALGILFLLVVLVDTVVEPTGAVSTAFDVAGWVIWAVFVLEFVLRAIIAPSRVRRDEVVPYTAEQARTLLAAAREDRLYSLYALALGVGLRRGELLGLPWQCLDLDESALRVRFSLQRLGSALTLTDPKTARSQRTLPLPGFCIQALAEHRDRQDTEQAGAPVWPNDWDLVFTTQVGTPIEPRNLNRHFDALTKRAGLPRIRLLSRPGARCRHYCRPVSPGRSPNPPCQFPGNGLSTVSAVRRGSRVAMGLGSCSPGRRSG